MQKAEDGVSQQVFFLDATMFMDMGGLLAAFEKEPEMPTEESFIEEWAAYEAREALEKGHYFNCKNGLGFDSEARPIIESEKGMHLQSSYVIKYMCPDQPMDAAMENTLTWAVGLFPAICYGIALLLAFVHGVSDGISRVSVSKSKTITRRFFEMTTDMLKAAGSEESWRPAISAYWQLKLKD